MNLLIPYIPLRGHPDPDFGEFTYGDVGSRGRSLHRDLEQGDFIFFHTSMGGKKIIAAYLVVEQVLDTAAACKDMAIVAKYRNPHIPRCIANKGRPPSSDDYLVFGDPIRSRLLPKPLLFDRSLADRLSLDIVFGKHRTEAQTIVSATRAWRRLTGKDVEMLLAAIRREENLRQRKTLMSTEEVGETIEKDIEDFLASNPDLIGKGMKLSGRQVEIKTGRIDLLFESRRGDLTIVEVKLGWIGRDALQQIRAYMHELRQGNRLKVRGVLVCSGVMPAYEGDIRKQRDVAVLRYGWDLKTQRWD